MNGTPISTQVEVIEAETPAGLPANSVLNIYDSCQLAALGFPDPKVRTILVTPGSANTGTLLIGYRTASPKNAGAMTYPAVDGKWYDLRRLVVKLGATGDTAIVSATR